MSVFCDAEVPCTVAQQHPRLKIPVLTGTMSSMAAAVAAAGFQASPEAICSCLPSPDKLNLHTYSVTYVCPDTSHSPKVSSSKTAALGCRDPLYMT